MAFSYTTVTQPYGAGATGTVTFVVDVPISNGGDYTGAGAAQVATPDGSGNISITLPSNLDAGTRPANSRTRVHERINGGNRIYYVQIPTSGPVTLASLAHTDDSSPLPAAYGDRYLMATSPAQPRAFTMDRETAGQSIALATGKAIFNGFTALADAPITSLSVFVRGTAAATITLARLGLYTVAGDGSVALVARTAASTTLGNATFAAAPAALDTTGGFPAAYAMTKGLRYALAALWVATTAPTLYGNGGSSAAANGFLPWCCTSLASQSDLPATVPIGSLVSETGQLLMAAY